MPTQRYLYENHKNAVGRPKVYLARTHAHTQARTHTHTHTHTDRNGENHNLSHDKDTYFNTDVSKAATAPAAVCFYHHHHLSQTLVIDNI